MAEVLGVAASAIAVVELSVNIISLCSQYLKDVKNAESDIETLKKEVINLETLSESVRELLNTPQGGRLKASQKLVNALRSSQSELESLENTLNSHIDKKKHRRLHTLKWPFESKDTAKLVHDLARYAQAISMSLQVDQTAILLIMDQKMVLDKLPVVEEAMFDSHAEEHNPTCLQGTRTDILQDIQNWARSPQEKPVFWLNGMAGTGKSTISRTAARLLSERGQLGASFFFKRGEQDRGTISKFFPTIAAQLVKREPGIAPYVKEAIDNDLDIFGKGTAIQFEKLVLAPLSQISQGERKTDMLVIIIDALDECDQEEDIRLLIRLLSGANHQDIKLRIFVTSRPDLHIRIGFSTFKCTYVDLILHTIPDTVVENDLKTYFNHELERIRDDYNNTVSRDRKLPSTWPGQSVIEDLAKISSPLFIFAATICRFLANRRRGAPDTKLEKVLQYKTKSQESKLDTTYLPILEQMMDDLSEREQNEALKEFRTIVGSIVVLFDPLSTSALAAVLQVPRKTIDARLDLLHSVLDIPRSPGLPVKPLHLSFRDFLLDPEKKGRSRFWVEETEMHRQMTRNCLRILNNSLQKDICEVRWPGTLREPIDPKVVNEKLPPEVQYACQYWTLHLQQSWDMIDEGGPVHKFLQLHSLHWLEALYLLGKCAEAEECVRMLLPLSNGRFSGMQGLHCIADLTKRFRHCSTPLQIYTEAALLDWEFEYFPKSDRPHWILPSSVPLAHLLQTELGT